MFNRCAVVLWGSFLIVAGAVFADGPTTTPTSNEKVRDYVQAALEYEIEGENDRRQVMLNAALEAQPAAPAANWHAGRVRRQGEWMTIADAQRLASADSQLQQYRELRRRAGTDPKLHLSLAHWCARQNLADQAKLHYRKVAEHPQAEGELRAEALKKLGLRHINGMLLTDEEIRARREAAEQIERAIKTWRPRLEPWREAMESDNLKQREVAAAKLEQVDDPHVIAVAETFLADSGPNFGERLVALVGRFVQHEATETLVRFAILSPWPNVREAAIAQLKERPLHDFLPMVLEGLTAPIQSRWSVNRGPDGSIHYQHAFFREGQQANMALAAEHVLRPQANIVSGQVRGQRTNTVDIEPPKRRPPNGRLIRVLPTIDDHQERLAGLAVLAAAREREIRIAQENAAVQARNDRVFHVLEQTTAAVLPRDAGQWWLWWEKYNEYVKGKPTQYVYVYTQAAYQRDAIAFYVRTSCFAAGTKVWTETGLAPIESVQSGDRVLSQDPNTGELAYKVVVNTTAGPPSSPLMRLMVEGEEILPTCAHVMWVNGQGWRIAKRLELGDWLHGVSGAVLVEELEERPAPSVVYNLVVEDFHTYFVGQCGLMVHDITYRKPTRALVPGHVAE